MTEPRKHTGNTESHVEVRCVFTFDPGHTTLNLTFVEGYVLQKRFKNVQKVPKSRDSVRHSTQTHDLPHKETQKVTLEPTDQRRPRLAAKPRKGPRMSFFRRNVGCMVRSTRGSCAAGPNTKDLSTQ